MSDYRERLERIGKRLDTGMQERRALLARLDESAQALLDCVAVGDAYLGAQSATLAIAQQMQQTIHARIASVVTKSLQYVFDEPYSFEIKFEIKRGKTEAAMLFRRGGVLLDDPLDAIGGGVVDVAAFALRVSALLLKRGAVRRCLIMDEPFKFVSAGYLPRVRELVERLAADENLQFIMVTHIDELKTGKVVYV